MAAIPTITVRTRTGLLDADLIEAWVPAAQVAIDRDFAPHWGGAALRYAPADEAVAPDDWLLVFLDHSDQASALGYHDLTPAGQPILKVFVQDCLDDGVDWNVTALHEVFEAIADPAMSATVVCDGYEYCVEVCDAPEDDRFAAVVAGHLASNAVTPAWFDPNGTAPFTIYPCAEITAPFMLASGGYVGRRKLPDGQWEQSFPDGERGARTFKKPSSRTMRRFAAC